MVDIERGNPDSPKLDMVDIEREATLILLAAIAAKDGPTGGPRWRRWAWNGCRWA
jgi:hypothetical protein